MNISTKSDIAWIIPVFANVFQKANFHTEYPQWPCMQIPDDDVMKNVVRITVSLPWGKFTGPLIIMRNFDIFFVFDSGIGWTKIPAPGTLRHYGTHVMLLSC